MSGVGCLGNTSVFGVFFIDGLSSGDVVDQLGQQQNHSDDGQNERHVIQRLIAEGILGGSSGGSGDSTAGSVVDIIELINGSGDAQTNDENEDDVEKEGVLSLGGQEEFQGDPNDHQTSAGQEKTTSGVAPTASDNILQAGSTGSVERAGNGFGQADTSRVGDFLTGNVASTLIRAPCAGVIVDFGVAEDADLLVTSVLLGGTSENEESDCHHSSEDSERLSTAETHMSELFE